VIAKIERVVRYRETLGWPCQRAGSRVFATVKPLPDEDVKMSSSPAILTVAGVAGGAVDLGSLHIGEIIFRNYTFGKAGLCTSI
jgi:hypothetical protein